VVSALEDPNPLVAGQGHARLRAAGLVVDVGIASEQARRAHAGHITRVRDARPHVTLKLAISADGKVALSGRRPVAITGEDARTRVHVMRAQNDAILIGIGTALSDDPALTCRLAGMQARSPVRIVLDPALRLPPESRLVRTAEETPVWLFGVKDASAAAEETLRLKGVEIIDTDISQDQMDVRAVLQELAARGITRLMVEGGPITAAAFVAADLVDEAYLFRSELRIGPDGIDALEGLPLEALTQSPQLKLVYSEPVGADRLDYFKRV
jgi:diaminohydroxyphosphoribosylaminopyrimidine deaminase/5-amino-6-(5-phosphoribosylamino)uracil reductase